MKQKIILLVTALMCALLFTACSQGGTAEPKPENTAPEVIETGTLVIRDDTETIAEVPLDKIKDYPSVRRQMMIKSSEGSTSHDFRGTLLSNILNDIDETLIKDYTSVKAVGSDTYQSSFTMEEVQAENNIYIMYSDSDQPILTKDGQEMGMRIVSLDDQYGQRFTNYLVEIVLEK